MIDLLSASLLRRGLIDVSLLEATHLISFTRAHSFGITVLQKNLPWRFIKVSEAFDMTDEVLRYQSAAAVFSGLVPEHLAFFSEQNLLVHVTQAIRIVPIHRHDFSAQNRHGAVQKTVLELFKRSSGCPAPDQFIELRAESVCETLLDFFKPDSRLRSRIETYFLAARISERINALIPSPQHGDFAKNNIGMSSSGAAIFDWEDFGRVQIPGLDLYLLLMSIRPNELEDQPLALSHRIGIESFIAESCKRLSITEAEFDAMLPVYAMLICFLRKSYGDGAKSRARAHVDLQLQLSGF
jgi:hypothetical protein